MTAPTKCGPRPLVQMEVVQVIKDTAGRFFVSFDGDNGHGPFKTREQAKAYASQPPAAADQAPAAPAAAEPATAHDMAFELAAHLAELLVLAYTMNAVFVPTPGPAAVIKDARASLERFHAWCEAGPDL